MADWYVSSAAYASIAAFAASHAYIVGDLIKPTAPSISTSWVFRCTTAGTSSTEPSWTTTNNGTSTSGTATFTNVTGQSTYAWSAAAGTLNTISATRPAAGDRVFLSSDHSESSTTTLTYSFNSSTAAFGLIQIISVNRAGSTPPVAADITSGAAITEAPSTGTGLLILDGYCNLFWQGVIFSLAGTPSISTHFYLNNAATTRKTQYLKNCTIVISTALLATRITSNNCGRIIFDNTTVQFGSTSQMIGPVAAGISFDFNWINTPSAIQGGTIPTILFGASAANFMLITCRGVDISAITGTLLSSAGATVMNKMTLDSCRIASGATRFSVASSTGSPAHDEFDLVNCYDGTNVLNERYTPGGTITTDRTTYLTGGTQDDVGNYSLKMVSSTRSDFATMPLDCFAFDVENTATGSSKTATVEIISSGSLNNNDIRLQLQYMGTSGNPIASFGDSLATVLTAASALTSSSNTWTSPPATPQKQLLQVSFTPQRAGRVRGLVRLGKISTTVWVNPCITIT